MLAFRPGDFKPRIGVMLGLTDPVCGLNMGQTAEVLYRDYGIPREQQDAFALESHQKTVKARAKLAEETCTVYLPNGKYVDKDNGVRENQTMEALAKLRPIFDKRNGTVTAGNASQVTDGAVALLVMEEEKARRQNFKPLGYLAGLRLCRASIRSAWGWGRRTRFRKCWRNRGVRWNEMQLIEINEAFAVQVLAVELVLRKEFGMEINHDLLNVNGGAIALGHPVGRERGAAGAHVVERNEASQPEDGHRLRLRRRRAGRRVDSGAGMMQSPRIEYDAEGIAWVVFDDPESKVNVLGIEQMKQLDAVLDELYKHKPKAVVFISAKPGIFIAGADINELQRIHDASLGADLSRAGHRIFAKIEQLGVPTVAAIDGACLGGGCELALACQYRVAADGPKTQIGLPETQLGIIPGWGGSQRLPRLIGLGAALDIICAGKSVSADKARRIGLVDAAVPSVVLRETATRLALGQQRVKRKSRWTQNWWPMRRFICRVARKRVLLRTEGRYPAPLRAIDAMEEGLRGSLAEGLEIESKIFGEVSVTSQCRNLIRLFFLREKYSKLVFNPETVERTGPITRESDDLARGKSGGARRGSDGRGHRAMVQRPRV